MRLPHSRTRTAIAAVATLAIVTMSLSGAPTARAASGGFATSFEGSDPAPLATTAYAPSTNITGQAFGAGSLLPFVASVSASAQNAPNEAAVRAADGDKTTKWLAFVSSAWLEYHLTDAKAAVSYSLTSADDAPERDPRDFTVSGSHDGSAWTVLDTRTGETWQDGSNQNRQTTRAFSLTNSVAYEYYRLTINSNQSGGLIQLADWELLEDSDGSIPLTPMVTEVGTGPVSSPTAKSGAGFTGTHSLRYAGQAVADGIGSAQSLIYQGIGTTIEAGDQLSYRVFPVLDAGLTYASTYAAVDLIATDGTRLSATGAIDAYGFPADAAGQGDGNILVPDQWNSVAVDLSSMTGKEIADVVWSVDLPSVAAGTSFVGWVDDIEIATAPARDTSDGLVSFVDTRRGSNSSGSYSRGNTFPAAAMPNGFNFFTPFTNADTVGSVYEYSKANSSATNLPRLQGIGISHEPSIWMGDRNQLVFMPAATAIPTSSLSGRALEFSHDNEVARPDLYSVEFANGIETSVTPTDHGGVYQFTFAGAAGSVVVDKVSGDSGLQVAADGTVSGWVDGGSGWPGRTRMFVYGEFDATPTAAGATTTGDRNGSARYAAFDTSSDKTVELRLATSFISLDQAQHNFDLEVAGVSFAAAHNAAMSAWNGRLGVIDGLSGATDTQKVTLYSSLYRLNLYPNSQFENVGSAATPDYKYASPVSSTEGAATATETNAKIVDGKVYVNNGFWDTYRTAWPLYSLLYPDIANELVDGFVQQYRDGGWVARWSSPGYADLMTGTSSDVAFADAYLAGALGSDGGFADVLDAYDAAVKNATVLPVSNAVGRKGLDESIFLGWTPESTHQSASWGLEGYINDFGIAQMAAALAEDPRTPSARVDQLENEAAYFEARAHDYVNVFNPEAGVFTSRNADGTFSDGAGFDKQAWGGAFTEASGWTFAFHVPYDVDGLAALFGSRADLVAELDSFMSTPEQAAYSGIHEAKEARDVRLGMLGMSNQVAHHIPYIYAAAGKPASTQEIVREITQRLYAGSDIGQGFLGDEDNGEMSAWYVFSALGFYPLQVGSGDYTIGSPLFDQATLHLANGDLTISAPGASEGKVYVGGVTIDGQPWNDTALDGDVLRHASTLIFAMSSTPASWGAKDQGEALEVPQAMIDATSSAFGALSAAEGTSVGALADNKSTSTVSFSGSDAVLTWDSSTGPVALTRYSLTNTSGAANTAPKNWTLEGSNDAATWTVVDRRADQEFPWATQTRPFSVTEGEPWSHYRLTITSAGGNLALAEVELIAQATEGGELALTPSDGLTATADATFVTGLATLRGPASDASAYDATADFHDGAGAVPVTLTANGLGGFTVTAPHTFNQAGAFSITVTAGLVGQSETVSTQVMVNVTRDLTLGGAYNNVCIGDLGTQAGSCDGQGYSFFRDKLADSGFVQGATVQIPGTGLSFDLPDIAPGDPDNVANDGQTVVVELGAGATAISFIGTANEGAKDLTATLNFSDGTHQTVPLQFGDWVGAAETPSFGNIVVGFANGRLAGTAAEATIKPSGIFATAPVALDTVAGDPKTVVSVTLPPAAGAIRDGRAHLFAVASDGDRSLSTPLAVTGASVANQVIGRAFVADLARATGSHVDSSSTAVINWGDGTPSDTSVALIAGTVTAGHTYAAAGTFTVSVTVDDGVQAKEVKVRVVVVDPTAVGTALRLSSEWALPGGAVTVGGQGFGAGATVQVRMQPGSVLLGVAIADGTGKFSLPVTVPTTTALGTHTIVATASGSGLTAEAALTVAVNAGDDDGLAFTGVTALGWIVGAAILFLGVGGLMQFRSRRARTE